MNFVLDTNILVHLIRQTPNVLPALLQKGVFDSSNNTFISIVTVAEIQAFAYRNQWGVAKLRRLAQLLTALCPIPIDNQLIIESYVEIDAFSQGKHRVHALPTGLSARNMGKNDIWIAATTVTTAFADATLMTTDADFDCLHTIFFDIEKIMPS